MDFIWGFLKELLEVEAVWKLVVTLLITNKYYGVLSISLKWSMNCQKLERPESIPILIIGKLDNVILTNIERSQTELYGV